jgi:hypothetical protein
LDHERSRLTLQQRRRQRLIERARKLRVATREQAEKRPETMGATRQAANRLRAENDQWEAELAAEQAALNTVRQAVIRQQASHDLWARWNAEVGAGQTPLVELPTDDALSAREEAQRQVDALAADSKRLEQAVRDVFQERAAADTESVWEAIRMTPAGEAESELEDVSEQWRAPLRRELALAVDATPLPFGLPAEVESAVAAVERAATAGQARRALQQALDRLEEARARATTIHNFSSTLDSLTSQAEAIEDFALLKQLDQAREQLELSRDSRTTAELNAWTRDQARELRQDLDQAKAAHAQRATRVAAHQVVAAAQQAQELFGDVLRELGWVEVPMETWRPQDGRLVEERAAQLFRQPGQSAYAKRVQVDEDGELVLRTIRLGAAATTAQARQSDQAECLRQSEFDRDTSLPMLEQLLRDGLGRPAVDGPLLDVSHQPPALLSNIVLSEAAQAELDVQAERERQGEVVVEQARTFDH